VDPAARKARSTHSDQVAPAVSRDGVDMGGQEVRGPRESTSNVQWACVGIK
jgi:hypothetical protein